LANAVPISHDILKHNYWNYINQSVEIISQI